MSVLADNRSPIKDLPGVVRICYQPQANWKFCLDCRGVICKWLINIEAISNLVRTRSQNLKISFCQQRLKMPWKPMKCGYLSMKDGTNTGFGRSYVTGLETLREAGSIDLKEPGLTPQVDPGEGTGNNLFECLQKYCCALPVRILPSRNSILAENEKRENKD